MDKITIVKPPLIDPNTKKDKLWLLKEPSIVKCSLAALNTKQQKDVVIFYDKNIMGFVPYLLQVL